MSEHRLNTDTRWTFIKQIGRKDALPQPHLDQLLVTYWRAAHSYLMALVNRHEELANELADEFALRFLRGEYSNASPEKGRFRDYIKSVLRNLVVDHYRKLARANQTDAHLDPDTLPAEQIDTDFLGDLHAVILASAWKSLEAYEAEHKTPYATALRILVDFPQTSMTQLASVLSARTGKDINANAVRQIVRRARERFSAFLVDRVAVTCKSQSSEDLRDDLLSLGLYEHCRPAFEKRTGAEGQ